MGCVHFTNLIPRAGLSFDDRSQCAAVVANVVLHPITVVSIDGKSLLWFDTSCKLAAFSKREAYQIWAEALVPKDPKV